MIQDYLKKLHQLQLDTLDTLVNLTIDTNYDTEHNYPWLTITVTVEGYHKPIYKLVPTEYVYLNKQMYGGMYNTEEENEEHQAAVYAQIENFVKDKLKKLKAKL